MAQQALNKTIVHLQEQRLGLVPSPRNLPPLGNKTGVAMDAIEEDLKKRKISGKAMRPRLQILRNSASGSDTLASFSSSTAVVNDTPTISPVRTNKQVTAN